MIETIMEKELRESHKKIEDMVYTYLTEPINEKMIKELGMSIVILHKAINQARKSEREKTLKECIGIVKEQDSCIVLEILKELLGGEENKN